MKKLLRAMLGFAVGALVLRALERLAVRWLGGSAVGARGMLKRLRPAPLRDDTVLVAVRGKLARKAQAPELISARIEHGCVDLRGIVETRERARIVRAVARVRGVDSVIDLMTEARARASTSR